MEKTQSKYRWHIIIINVLEKNQTINIFEKLPMHLKRCVGVHYSVKKFLPTNRIDIPQVGEISLQFNSRKVHPLHDTISYSKLPMIIRPVFKTLCIDLEQNAPIIGFYTDYGLTIGQQQEFLPYSLTVYLECETQETSR